MLNSDESRVRQFLALYNRDQRRIYALIRALLFDRDEAEDVFQDTCLALWTSFADFESGSNFWAWAAQIARHRVLAHVKKQNSVPITFSEDAMQLIADRMIAQPDALDARLRIMESCIDKLSEKERLLVRRRYEAGVTIARLSEELGRNADALYKSLQKVRRSLLACIDRTLRLEGGDQ